MGDTVRLVCDRVDQRFARMIENGNIVFDGRTGTIPCGTVVRITSRKKGYYGRYVDYYVVPLDTSLPGGWLNVINIEELRFEKYNQ